MPPSTRCHMCTGSRGSTAAADAGPRPAFDDTRAGWGAGSGVAAACLRAEAAVARVTGGAWRDMAMGLLCCALLCWCRASVVQASKRPAEGELEWIPQKRVNNDRGQGSTCTQEPLGQA